MLRPRNAERKGKESDPELSQQAIALVKHDLFTGAKRKYYGTQRDDKVDSFGRVENKGLTLSCCQSVSSGQCVPCILQDRRHATNA